jgi:hypothetical protein
MVPAACGGEARCVGDEQHKLRELELAVVDIRGESGSNGKLGNLRTELEAAKKLQATLVGRFWALAMLVLGGAVGAAIKLVLIGRWVGALETQVEANRSSLVQQASEIQALQSLAFSRFTPASPGKDSP